jgi:hypothetical protein
VGVGVGVGVGHWRWVGHWLAKWPTYPQLKHVVVALAIVEPSLWLGAAFLAALIFCVGPKSSWVLLFLFLDGGLASIDCNSWLTSCICARICYMVRRSWAWTVSNCSIVEGEFWMSLLSPLLQLDLPSFAIWILKFEGKIRQREKMSCRKEISKRVE